MQSMTIGDFLLRRLAEIGTTHVFGVPGDYNMSFLEQLEAHPGIDWVGNCNELNAAYAADGYARSGKPGVLLTTYGVGCLSAVNGVAGAYCEHIPLIHISGAPPAHAMRDRVSLHHSLLDGGYRNVHRAFDEFTEYAATITSDNAVDVIDHALRSAYRSRRPVRLELPSDLTHVQIAVPSHVLAVTPDPATGPQVELAAAALADALAAAHRPVLLFDTPAVRWGALSAIEKFCTTRDIAYFCTAPVVHTADPGHPQYLGMVPTKNTARQQIFDEADLLIACGFTASDVTTGGFTLDLAATRVIHVQPTYVQDGTAVHYGTGIAEVLTAVPLVASARGWAPPPAEVVAPQPADGTLSQEFFFSRLADFLRSDDVLLAETGTSAQNTVGLPLPAGVRYINQSSWGSIGYALPALLGALVSSPQRRHVLCVGDGSFQVTAQELSTIIRHDLSPVIFLLNNRGYTIERSILGATSPYNDVANWAYHDLPRVFGIDADRLLARVVSTRAELDTALAEAGDSTRLTFIEVAMQPFDMTAATRGIGEATRVYDYGVHAIENPIPS